MPKTLVTGGAGFIGSHVTRALADRGDELRLTLYRVARDFGHSLPTASLQSLREMRAELATVRDEISEHAGAAFATGLLSSANGDPVNGSASEQRARLLHHGGKALTPITRRLPLCARNNVMTIDMTAPWGVRRAGPRAFSISGIELVLAPLPNDLTRP